MDELDRMLRLTHRNSDPWEEKSQNEKKHRLGDAKTSKRMRGPNGTAPSGRLTTSERTVLVAIKRALTGKLK